MDVRSSGILLRTWAGTFGVVLLLSGCGATRLPDIRMPDIRLSSLWPSGQGLSAAAPAKTQASPPPVPAQPVLPPVAQAAPAPAVGPTASVTPVESVNLPAAEAVADPMPGWMQRPASSAQVIRFSAAPVRPGLLEANASPPASAVPPVSADPGTPSLPGPAMFGTPALPAAVSQETFPSLAVSRRAALLVPQGPLGEAMRQAAMLAVFDVRKEGFELRPYETGPASGGVAGAVQMALADGAGILLGPVFAADAAVARPLAKAAGVPMVTFSTDWTLAGDGTYVIGFLPFTQVIRVVGHAASQGVKRLAILAPEGTYGDAVVETARWQAARSGTLISGVGRYDDTPESLAAAVAAVSNAAERAAALETARQQLRARSDEAARGYLAQLAGAGGFGPLPCDAVLVAQGGERLPEVLAALASADLAAPQVRLLGTGLWDDPGLWKQPLLAGAWFSAPSPALREGFTARYRQAFGENPPRLSTLAYDATALAMVMDGSAGSGQALQSPEGFVGIDGIFRFRSNGLVERGLPVLEIRDGRVRVVSPAPHSFTQAGQ